MAAGSTYTPIATTTLTSASASVTFSSISGSYTDLVLVCASKSASGATLDDVRIYLRFNSDSGSNYSTTYMTGDGTTAASFRDSNRAQIDNAASIPTNGSSELALFTYSINSYSSTSVFKSVIQRGGNNSNASSLLRQTGAAVSTWRNTSAITSILIFGGAGNSGVGFASGSTFTLYGILSA
jgi:hypothetical protein